MKELSCDVAVIGAGTAGLAAERAARRAGATTLLIDDKLKGTTCASVGCMPSKLLIAAGDAAHAIGQAGVFGIRVPAPKVDGIAVMERVRTMRDAFVAGTLESIDHLPDDVLLVGRARLASCTELQLEDGRRVRAKAIVIATGSAPAVPEMFAALGDLVLTNETIFDLTDLPASVAVIGAGPLGLELAQALARLGVDTAVFDHGKKLAGLHDDDLARQMMTILEAELPIHLGVELKARREGDAAVLDWSGNGQGSRRFARLLVATGRPPQVGDLGLETTGLVLDGHGTPEFDPHTLQCGNAPVFMAGDADADRTVLHEASSEGAIAGRNAALFPEICTAQRAVPLSIMFTDPPLAVVGETAGREHVIGVASYDDQGRAKVEARNAGGVRLYATKPDGRLVGAVLAAPGADHMGHLIAWAIARGETATGLLDLPFYHPTLEEGLKPALREICTAVHAPLPFDSGTPAGA